MTPSLILAANGGSVDQQELIGGLDGTGIWVDKGPEALGAPIPTFDEVFAEGPDSEGGPLVSSRPQNVKGVLKVNIGARDDANAFYSHISTWQSLIANVRRYGGQLAYTPEDGDQVVYQVVSAAITEMPQDGVLIPLQLCQSTAEFTFRPFASLASQTQNLSLLDTFTFDTITNQGWLFDTGSGTLSVSGGQLVPSSTAAKVIYHQGNKAADQDGFVKFTTGASVAATWNVDVGKRLDSSNRLYVRATASGLQIRKNDAGSDSQLGSTTSYTFATATSYWLEADIVGNVVTGNLYTTDPNGSSPSAAVATVTTTLTGGDATKFGSGVYLNPSIGFTPKATDWRVDDFRVDAPAIESTRPMMDFWALDVPGSAPALPTITLTERSSQNRNFFDYGLSDDVDRSSAVPALIDSDSFSLSGFTSTQTTRTGAYDPAAAGNSVVRSPALTTSAVGVATVLNGVVMPGPWMLKARIYCPNQDDCFVHARYASEGYAFEDLSWVELPVVNGFAEVKLGIVVGDPTQPLYVQLRQKSPSRTSQLDFDYVEFYPALMYGDAGGDSYPLDSGDVSTISYNAVKQSGNVTLPSFAGKYPKINPGDARLAVKARRNNVLGAALDDQIADALRVSMTVIPRVQIL